MQNLALSAYLMLARLWLPLWRRAVTRRARKGKEDPARLSERFGKDTRPRPEGPLLWAHALGIGEATALLAVLRALRQARPDLTVLLTTNTRGGADGLAKIGLPEGVIHAYAPIDAPTPVRRFLDHWHPDALLLAELDLWPYTLTRARQRGLPMIVANARLTDHRFAQRKRYQPLFAATIGLFDRVLVQDAQTHERLVALGGDPARTVVAGLLKAAAAPQPDNAAERIAMAQAIASRPVWLAAATEARELPTLLDAHRIARERHPDLLLIVAPRQLSGADADADTLRAAFGTAPRCGAGELPGPGDAVYLADSMGEMGIWYRLAPVAFIGHSLPLPGLTGKNPFEAAHLGAAILHGPNTGNFAESYAALTDAGGARAAATPQDIARALTDLIDAPEDRQWMADAARTVLDQGAAALDTTVATVLRHLPPP